MKKIKALIKENNLYFLINKWNNSYSATSNYIDIEWPKQLARNIVLSSRCIKILISLQNPQWKLSMTF